ncbi:MAG: alpha/beta hydrolase [Gammaproteobacteria bacterium]|nr:alpha/beta hydrolase [Gammaproteobacteria bacterium]MDH4311338.1 alpha/beta hydrolase [Gammaproteobacteria bacterium]
MIHATKIVVWSLLLVAGALGAAFIAWRVPDQPVSALQAKWAPPPSTFVEVRGMQVHLRDEGPRDDPLPIVLLHGTGASLHTWDGWTGELARERRVIRFDLPGFGLTGPSPDGVYTIESYVDTVLAVADTLGVQRLVLAGNSLGGYVAWATAVLHPARVDRLILVDAAGYPFQSQSVPLAFRIARTPVLNVLMRDVLPRAIVASSLRDVYGDPSRVTPGLIDRYFDLATRAGNRAALVARFDQTQPGSLAERVREIQVPTLILWGGQDRLIPLEFGEQFARDIHGSLLVVFDRLGHVPHEEDPARTVAAVLPFIRNGH